MAVSKRLRHEVMRRDNHTCKYCGATAPDVKLTIDHVTPTTLGGSDDPSNLVTACADCNAGKSATPPDAALVADVDQRAVEWAQAMTVAVERRAAELDAERGRTDQFDQEWRRWNAGGEEVWRDQNWRASVLRLLAAGLTDQFLIDAVGIAMRSKAKPSETWRYFCGVCWREVDKIQAVARKIAGGQQVRAADDTRGAAAPTPALRGPTFDYMSMFDEFARLVVRTLGGTRQMEIQIVDRCLWDVMPELHREMMEGFETGDHIDDVLDYCRDYLTSYVQLPFAQVENWRAAGHNPLDVWSTADDRWEAIDGHSNTFLLMVGTVVSAAGQAGQATGVMKQSVELARKVHDQFEKLCVDTVFESTEIDQDLLVKAFKLSFDSSPLLLPGSEADSGEE